MPSCNEKTKAGKQCKAKAMPNGKCAMHQHPNRAKELARKSVESRRRVIVQTAPIAEIPPPTSADDLVSQLGQIFADLRSGKIDVGIARTTANVAQVILKGLELTDAKKQLNRIEELLRERYYKRDQSEEAGQEDHDS